MKFTPKQLGYILYNNRSIEGVVSNFLDKSININELINIEKKFDWCKSLYDSLHKMVEIDISLLDSEANDEIVTPEQLDELTNFVKSNIGNFSEIEIGYLTERNISIDVCNKYKILGLSVFKDFEHLRRIGATCHPVMRTLLEDGIEGGGIVFPLFENDKLVNCQIRKISNVGKLKYTLAVPDIPVWGLENVEENSEVWVCEGIFDMIALCENGHTAICPTSAIWSGIQLYKVLEKKPKMVKIFCDNDRIGLKTGLILTKFFNLFKIPSVTIHSKYCKDACEHFFEKNFSTSDLDEIVIDRKMIEDKNDNSFDFLRHLQKRKF
jgi:hypothetical protein